MSELTIPEYVDSWDTYFSCMALVASIKSKDENCRVGAVIVSPSNVVLSTGFNGLARGVYDDKHILQRKNEKLKVICHAEQNAILNAARVGVSVEGATIYVTKFPCLACCNAIIQAGIKRIYTHDASYWNGDPFDKSHLRKKSILRQTHITVDAPFHSEYFPKEQITVEDRRVPRITVPKKPPARVTMEARRVQQRKSQG
ncbi:MAG: dCMP deaminase family protein [Candidatus Sulfotelmatobacter sp.]